MKAPRVPAGGQTTLHASQVAGVQQHRTGLGPLRGILLEACSRCSPLPDRWDKVGTDISEATSKRLKLSRSRMQIPILSTPAA